MRKLIKKLIPVFLLRYFYRIQVYKYAKSLLRNCKIEKNAKTILVVNHFFSQDVKALELKNTKYNIVIIDPTKLFKAGRMYFSEEIQGLNAPYESESDKNKQAWRDESLFIINQLEKISQINCLITPADDFYWIRECIGILKRKGVPVVVLDKEGTISPFDFNSEAERIKTNAPFVSDYALVWSERQKRYWKNKGVSGDMVKVVGQARSDLFYQNHGNTVDKNFSKPQPLVTFFSFEDDAYAPLNKNGLPDFTWKAMKTKSHDDFYKLSEKHKNINFVLKTHPQQSDVNELQSKYCSDNFCVIGGSTTSNELIVKSKLIIGFQTTGLIEAMFLNKPVVYLCWDKNIRAVEDKILPFEKVQGIKVIHNEDVFFHEVDSYVSKNFSGWDFSDEEIEARNKFVQEYFYRPDGKVCERIYGFLDEIL